MPGLIVNGAMTLGAAPTASVSTLPAYLSSIGKNSWYARFAPGTNMWTSSGLTGSAVSLNGNLGSWGPDSSNTSNFTAYWNQATVSNYPVYAAANGINSLYSSSNNPAGAGDTRHLQLSSTTALNGAYTVIVRMPLIERDGRSPFSHNSSSVYFISGSGSSQLLSAIGASGTTVPDQIIHVVRNTPGTSIGNCTVGISQTGTAHNGTAPYLLRRSTTYSASAISDLWFTPQLTASELYTAMTFIT